MHCEPTFLLRIYFVIRYCNSTISKPMLQEQSLEFSLLQQ